MRHASAAFEAVVFDMDGLLLDSERPIRDAWLQAAAQIGVPLSEADYLSIVGLNHVESAARMLTFFGGVSSAMLEAGRLADATLDLRFGERPFDIKPGALTLLRGLKAAGIPCAVASSTKVAEVERRLRLAGLLEFFASICGGDEVERGKPNPDLYLLAVARLGADARTTLAFEDSGHGVQAALAAGLAVVAVPDLKGPEPMWQTRCLAVLTSLHSVCERSRDWFDTEQICAP